MASNELTNVDGSLEMIHMPQCYATQFTITKPAENSDMPISKSSFGVREFRISSRR